MEKLTLTEEIENIYHIDRWGEGYFTVNDSGNLCVSPERTTNGPLIDVAQVISEVKQKNISMPLVIRFHDILRSQVIALNTTFNKVINDAEYKGQYFGVYPIKVNQMREVVEEIMDAGKDFNYGLEAGSKPELLSVLALNHESESLTILNGYKDADYLKLGLLGRKLGKKVFVVIEKFSELTQLVSLSKEMNIEPLIGIRTKLSITGSGKWSASGGEKAKFGLSIPEIINSVIFLRKEGLLHCLKLLHFHVGSQVPNIQTIKEAISEGGRIYCELRKMGVPLEFIDVGGGLAVDYDGSQSTSDSSKNYNMETYASDIIYTLKQIAELEGQPHPNIVSESGRAVTAHHSCVVVEVLDKIDSTEIEFLEETPPEDDEHILVKNIREILKFLNTGNTMESFNDALSIKRDSENAFKLNVLSLNEKAIIDTSFWKICRGLKEKIDELDFVPEDFEYFNQQLSVQYLCNFSVFQSLPDTWAIDQLLPIVPISRLNEMPTENCTLADITCDSDGKIDKFVDLGENKNNLLLHKLKSGENYHIGFFLTGAYQDVMGDMHNLFGRVNEVHIFYDEESPKNYYIEEVINGSSSKDVLSQMQYNTEHLAYMVKKNIDKKVSQKTISPREGVDLIDFYEECLYGYTYLKK